MITLLAFTVLFTPGPQYASELPFKFLGWRSGGRYAVLESEVGGVGPETQVRVVVDAKNNKVVKRWTQETESADRPVSVQSDGWMKQHPSSGLGRLVFAFKGHYFTADKDVAPQRAEVNFKVGQKSFSVMLKQTLNSPESTPGGEMKFRRAKCTVAIRCGQGTWRSLRSDADFAKSVVGYGIDRVYTDGKSVAVVLVQFNGIYFEGWNLAAERTLVVGLLP